MKPSRFLSVSLIVALCLLMSPERTAAKGKIVFSQGANGNELWVVNNDGTGLHKLLTMSSYIVTPRWSGNGQQIAFQSGTQLWIVNEDGSNLHAVPGPAVADAGLTWDSSGTSLIYATVCVCCEHLRAVNADGSNDRLFFNPGSGVIQDPDARPFDDVPSSRVAYFRFQCGGEFSSQFFGLEMTREGGADFVVIPASAGIDRQQRARWSSDGSKLVSVVRIAETRQNALEILDPFDSNAGRNRILKSSGTYGGVDFGCSLSIIFFSWGESVGPRDIFRYNRNTKDRVRITSFGSGSVRDLDFFCTPEQSKNGQAVSKFAAAFDVRTWQATAGTTAQQLLPGLPEDLADLLNSLWEDAVSAHSPAASNLLAARDAMRLIIQSWLTIEATFVESLLNDMDALATCKLARRPLSTILNDLKNQDAAGGMSQATLDEARAVAFLYKDMLDHPQNYASNCAPFFDSNASHFFFASAVNGLRQELTSLTNLLLALGAH